MANGDDSDCTNIFSTVNGRIARVVGDTTLFQYSIAACSGNTITEFYDPFNAVVTSIGIQGQGGYQFMHTLSDFIYLYVFNERVGQLVFSGLAFAQTCDDTSGKSGMELLLNWYDKNRVTSCEDACIVTLGSYSFTAFLTSIKMDIINPENGIAQFSLIFTYIPNQSPIDPCSMNSSGSSVPTITATAAQGAPTILPATPSGIPSSSMFGPPGSLNAAPGM